MLGAEGLFYVLNLLEFLGFTLVIETEQIQEHLEPVRTSHVRWWFCVGIWCLVAS